MKEKPMPNNWKTVKLGDIGEFGKGLGASKAELLPNGINAVRYGELYAMHNVKISNITSFISSESAANSKLINKGDILLAGSGETIDEIGKSAVYLLDEPCYAGGDVIIFTPDEQVDPLFLAYYLNSHTARRELRRLGQGQSVVHIYSRDLREMDIHLPSLSEQKRIAAVLESSDQYLNLLDKKIALNKKIRKDITIRLVTGALRLQGFVNPWQQKKIGDFAESKTRLNTKNIDYEVLSCTKHDGLVRSLEYFKRKVYGDDLSKYKLVPNDYFAYATNHIEEGSIGYQNLLEVGLVSPMYTVFKTTGINNIFLYKLLKTPRAIFEYQRHMTASVARRGGLRWSSFSQIKLKIPDITEQNSIANVLSTIDREILLLHKKRNAAYKQRIYLVNRLVTGEIQTPENLITPTRREAVHA